MTTSRSDRLGWALALALGSTGCSYTVRMLSEPAVATLILPDGKRVPTPAEVRLRWTPKGQPVRVEARGHCPLTVDLQRTEGPVLRYIGGAVFQRGGREVTVILEPVRPDVPCGP